MREGPNATYINEDESLEQIDILLAKKPTEMHNKDILDSPAVSGENLLLIDFWYAILNSPIICRVWADRIHLLL